MDAWTIYWILQLDSINCFAIFAGTGASLACVVAVFARIGSLSLAEIWQDMPDSREYKRYMAAANGDMKLIKPAALVAVVMLGIATFLPSSKTAAAMVVLPAIVNNETIRKESGELYDLAKQALREAVTDKAKEAAK